MVLQHGSILCGSFHRKLVEYLNCNDDLRHSLSIELNERTTELQTILKEEIDYDKLKTCLMFGFELEWEVKFEQTVGTFLT